jgi:hypothetical protein
VNKLIACNYCSKIESAKGIEHPFALMRIHWLRSKSISFGSIVIFVRRKELSQAGIVIVILIFAISVIILLHDFLRLLLKLN